MTIHEGPHCDEVQMAAMAHRDGERAALTPAEVEAHLAGCAACRAEVAALSALGEPLTRLDDDAAAVDVWPGVQGAIVASEGRARRDGGIVFVLAAALALWRLAQLSLDLPAPVVNSVVPLALTVLVLWRISGDPFAIEVRSDQLKGEGV